MSKYKNISDGESDGLGLVYMKDGKLHSVGLTQDQADMLDLTIGLPFAESGLLVLPVLNVKDGVIKKIDVFKNRV